MLEQHLKLLQKRGNSTFFYVFHISKLLKYYSADVTDLRGNGTCGALSL